MRATGFAYPDGVGAATGYHPRWSPMRAMLPRWVMGEPAGRWVGFRRFLLDGSAYGGLVGTADDAARFLRMHLCDGELDGARIVSAEPRRRCGTSGCGASGSTSGSGGSARRTSATPIRRSSSTSAAAPASST